MTVIRTPKQEKEMSISPCNTRPHGVSNGTVAYLEIKQKMQCLLPLHLVSCVFVTSDPRTLCWPLKHSDQLLVWHSGYFAGLTLWTSNIGLPFLFFFPSNQNACRIEVKKTEGVLFQDSQDLVVRGCENNTAVQAVREIVNRGIHGTVKRALKLSATPKPLHRGVFECGTLCSTWSAR